MTSIQLLEILVSLSLQAAALTGLTTRLTRRNTMSGAFTERLWTSCLLAVCGIIPAVLAFPCLRLLPVTWINAVLTATGTSEFSRLAGVTIAIWGMGACLALLGLILGWCRTARFLKRRTRPIDTAAEDGTSLWKSETARTRTNGPSNPVLLGSEFLSGPFCWQFHRPIVVLPDSVFDFPELELRLVIRHELIHLSRQHPLQLFLQKLLDVVFWFHPSIHHLSQQLDRSRELVCDQLAIHDTGEAHAYLSSLLRLAEGPHALSDPPEGGIGFFRKRRSWIQDRASAIAGGLWEQRATAGSRYRQLLIFTAALLLFPVLRLPIDTGTSRTELISPWPQWSADALHSLGIDVRDYEPDWYITPQHEHHVPIMPADY
ncbi:hypothetical protein GC176_09125 [bacterium]|nr:hypothetical protein [bacterium]